MGLFELAEELLAPWSGIASIRMVDTSLEI